MELEPADWPQDCHLRATLLHLDEAASCAICHGPFNVPLTLPCGHSFCAACIRSNLEYQERSAPARCPQCRERCDTRQLHQNLALQGLINAFMAARTGLVQLAAAPSTVKHRQPDTQTRSRAAASARGPCQGNNARRARQNGQAEAPAAPQAPSNDLKRKHSESTSSSSRSQAADSSQSCLESDYRPSQRALSVESGEGGSEEEADCDEPGDNLQQPSKRQKQELNGVSHKQNGAQAGARTKQREGDSIAAYSTCPSCSASVPTAVINDHLDKCLQNHASMGDAEPASAAAAPSLQAGARKGNNARGARAVHLQVPPKLAMSLLKDKDLRQKLKQYTLPTTGKRQEMEQRYARFRVAVQTALDSGEGHLGYAEVARRLVTRDKQAAVAGLPSHVMPKATRASDSGGGFNELIQATKARKASANAGKPAVHDLTGDDTHNGAATKGPASAQNGRQLVHTQSLPAHSSMTAGNESSAQQDEAADEAVPAAAALQHAETAPGDLSSPPRPAVGSQRRSGPINGVGNEHADKLVGQAHWQCQAERMQDDSEHEGNGSDVEVVADSESGDS